MGGVLRTAIRVTAAAWLLAGIHPLHGRDIGDEIVGRWVGSAEVEGRWRFVRFDIALTQAVPSVEGWIPAAGLGAIPGTVTNAEGPGLTIKLPSAEGEWRFEGTTEGDRLSGAAMTPGGGGLFELSRSVELTTDQFDPLIGTYGLPGEATLLLTRWRTLDYLFVFDGEERLRLYPLAPDRFYSERGDVIYIVRAAEGQEVGLAWQNRFGLEFFYPPVEVYQQEEVVFQGAGEWLAGTLLLPPGDGPHPAIVLVHGSGADTRHAYRPVAHLFAQAGIAALFYDKRGTGDSTGNWFKAGLNELAGDAVGAVSYLGCHQAIDAGRIGLWGISQGGWISTIAAAESREVAFLVPFSGAAVSPAEQELFRIARNIRDLTGSEGLVDITVKMEQLTYDFLYRAQASSTLAGKPWLPGLDMQYDPRSDLARLDRPVLALFGELDSLVPVGVSARRYEQLTVGEGEASGTIRVAIFPQADHGLMLTATGSRFEVRGERRYAPGVWELTLDWVRAVVDGTVPPAPGADLLQPADLPPERLYPGRPSWFGSAPVQLALLLLFAAAFGSCCVAFPVVAEIDRRRGGHAGRTSRFRFAAWVVSVWNLLLLAGFSVLLVRLWTIAGAEVAEVGNLPRVLTSAGAVSIVGSLLLSWMTAKVWQEPLAGPFFRWYYSTVALAALLLIPFLAYWSLLPFSPV
ncbi:MAG: alpha/beta hydrolase [Thermoanaerobaculia bacterium]